MQKVYTKIESIVGNVVTVRASGVRSGDLALVGESYANVIKLDKDLVTLQVFSGTQGVSTTDPVRFLGRPRNRTGSVVLTPWVPLNTWSVTRSLSSLMTLA